MQLLKIAALAAAVGYVCLPLPAGAAPSAPDAPPATLTVVGQGRISRPPDSASVALSIVTNDDSAARALSENNRRFVALSGKITALGIAASDVSSASIQSYFNPRPAGQNTNVPGQLYGFVVTRYVQITVNALTQTGAVVDAATAAGATHIDGVSYDFRDRRAVERAAAAAAVADAYAQAQALAGAAHVEIVRVLRIGNEPAPGRMMPMAMSMAKTADAPVPTTITPSDVAVESSVTVTYLIR